MRKVKSGEHIVMLVDSGTPCISDPGYLLVKNAIQMNIEPQIVPGASALLYSVVASGFPVTHFIFAGFLPRRKQKRRTTLKELTSNCRTVFLFESPYRIKLLLTEIVEEIGPETYVVMIREATKIYEERIRGKALELLKKHSNTRWKGEFTIGITTFKPDVSDEHADVTNMPYGKIDIQKIDC